MRLLSLDVQHILDVYKSTFMDDKTRAEKREAFLRIYANLPLSARKEIIAVLDPEGPITWEAAYFEMKNNTPSGIIILEKLVQTKII
jgi:hypothetical protein